MGIPDPRPHAAVPERGGGPEDGPENGPEGGLRPVARSLEPAVEAR